MSNIDKKCKIQIKANGIEQLIRIAANPHILLSVG